MAWIRRSRPTPGTIFGFVALVIALGGVAVAAIPDSKGTIHGCYQKSNGNLRVVDSPADCRNSEQTLDWNQRGPVGPPGQPAGSLVRAFERVVPVGQAVVLLEQGPFTLTATCSAVSGGLVDGRIIVSTTREHSVFDATPGPSNLDFGPATPESSRIMYNRSFGEETYFVSTNGPRADPGVAAVALSGNLYRTDNSVDTTRCVLGGFAVVNGT